MINVPIIYIQDTFFDEDGVEYKYESSYNSRFVCRKVSDPTAEILFSAYDTVQVTEEHAKKIKFLVEIEDIHAHNIPESGLDPYCHVTLDNKVMRMVHPIKKRSEE